MYVVLFRGHFYVCDSTEIPGHTQRDNIRARLILQEAQRTKSPQLLDIVGRLVVQDVRGAVHLWNKTFPDDKIIWRNIPVLRVHERRKWTVFD